jgi:hypothetical protein
LWRLAAQRVHELCSATVLYWPVGHAVQTEAPPELNLPEGHGWQLVSPWSGLKRPGAHWLHVPPQTECSLPAGQL